MARENLVRTEVRSTPERGAAGPVQRRRTGDDDAAHAWPDTPAIAVRVVAAWQRAVARAERDLVRLGCWFALLDVATGLSACFVPTLTSALILARAGALIVLVPAGLRRLANRCAEQPGVELLRSLAIALGVAALYLMMRTGVVVEVCGL